MITRSPRSLGPAAVELGRTQAITLVIHTFRRFALPALRLVASVALLIAAGILLFVAGFGIYFAISTASDGIGGGDERERFISALIEASAFPSGVALLIAGTIIWQHVSHAFRALPWGIGLMLIPGVAAWLIGPDRLAIPIGQGLAIALPLSLVGLAATYWLQTHGSDPPSSVASLSSAAVPPGRKRRIASLVIALFLTVPLLPLVVFLAALSFNPLEAADEPNVWAGIAIITFGIGMFALVVVAAIAMVRPQRSMLSFVAVSALFAFAWLLPALAGGFGGYIELEEWVFPIAVSALPLFLGWLSRVPEDGHGA